MSRFAGYFTPSPTPIDPRVLPAMGAQLATQSGTSSTAFKQQNCSIIWRGRSTSEVFQDKKTLVFLDGQVCNAPELSKRDSDAAVIAELYEAGGMSAVVSKVGGEYAFGLFDSSTQELFLVRDRFGTKPLFYSRKNGSLVFASTPWALFKFPGMKAEATERFVALFAGSNYRTFYSDPERSMYKDILQVPAGHYLKFKNEIVEVKSYWEMKVADETSLSEDALAGKYEELLERAVRRRLRKVKKPAFTLSGGMDSSSIISLAKKVTGCKQHAFSTVYDDKTYDESEDISAILPSVVEEWHPLKIAPTDLLTDLQRAIRAANTPIITSNYLGHFLMCEEVQKGAYTHLFGGLGGDELNAGEYDHFFYFFADLKAQGLEKDFLNEVDFWSKYHNHPVFKKNKEVADKTITLLVDLEKPGRCKEDLPRIQKYMRAVSSEFFNLERERFPVTEKFRSYLKNRTYQDLLRETIPPCLVHEDRHTNYFGMESVLPFFDHEVAEFMFSVPVTAQIQNGVAKQLLRKAMRGILCEETRTRIKKTGWNAPAHVWFQTSGGNLIKDVIHSKKFRERGIYNYKEVERLFAEHNQIIETGAEKENHMMFFWQLLNLETWLNLLHEIR